MRFVSKLLFAGVLVPCSLAGAVPASHVVHEKRDVHSHTWVKRARVEGSAVVPVRIGLRQSNLEKAHEYLMDV